MYTTKRSDVLKAYLDNAMNGLQFMALTSVGIRLNRGS